MEKHEKPAPSTVAMVEYQGKRVLAMRYRRGFWFLGEIDGQLKIASKSELDSPPEPCAVIRPEDLDELAQMLLRYNGTAREIFERFSQPAEPPMDEPTYVGALVKDADGDVWVCGGGTGRWQCISGRQQYGTALWARINNPRPFTPAAGDES